jgi:hypothetical protein
MVYPSQQRFGLFQPQITPNTVSYVLYFDSYKAPTVLRRWSAVLPAINITTDGQCVYAHSEPGHAGAAGSGMGLAPGENRSHIFCVVLVNRE